MRVKLLEPIGEHPDAQRVEMRAIVIEVAADFDEAGRQAVGSSFGKRL